MSKWGVIGGNDGWLHIAPVDDAGLIAPPHVVSVSCYCEPNEDSEYPNSILVHNDPERGGCNA